MRKVLILTVLLFLLVIPVSAVEAELPIPPQEALELMPAQDKSFAEGLLSILSKAFDLVLPELRQTGAVCLSVIAVMLIASILGLFSDKTPMVIELSVSVGIGLLLTSGSSAMIQTATETVSQLSEYGKLLLPVMAGALASQGGVTSATALYAGTAVFDTVLGGVIRSLSVPVVYAMLVLSMAAAATGNAGIVKLKGLIKWFVAWVMKGALYLFTGYMAITGVVSGAADASAIKAAKLTISSMVPVVGGILSDASEAVIVGAGVIKGAMGLYGVLAILAIWITPFLSIGIRYLLLKLTGAVCEGFGMKRGSSLIADFSSAMGMLLGMIGTLMVMLLITTVCFMKAVT